MPDLPPNSQAIGQKDGKKWAAAVDLQPTISKSDRLLASETAESAQEEHNAALTAELFYELLISEMAHSEGDAATGYALMLDAARRSNDPRLYRRASEMALQSRSADAALTAIRAWSEAYPDARDANRYLLYVLVKLNRVNDSAEPLAKELASSNTREKLSAIRAIPQLYAQVSSKTAAARVVEQVLQAELTQPATGPAAWTTLGRMRLAASDSEGALQAAREALALDPRDDGAAALALQLFEEGAPTAEALLPPYLAATPLPELRLAYARLLLQGQRLAEAQTQVDAVTQESPEIPQAWLIKASLELQTGKLDAAKTALERYLTLTQDSPESERRERAMTQAWLMLAQIAEKQGDYTEAERLLAQIRNPEAQLDVQTRRAALLARQGKLSQARALIRAIPEQNADDQRLKLQTEAQLLRDAGEYQQAYALQSKAAALAPQDDDLAYDLAMLAEKAGHLREAEHLLRAIIARKPRHQHALNALGYMLADRGERLTEARSLIQRALELAPQDPFITDSLGWVEFRLGQPEKALELLQQAFKLMPDAEIAAHLGEVLWSLGQREAALQIWREGQKLNADNTTLRATLKRLKVTP